jgi:hypothetical protein
MPVSTLANILIEASTHKVEINRLFIFLFFSVLFF